MAISVSIIDGMTQCTDDDLASSRTDFALQPGVLKYPQYQTPLQGLESGTPDKNTNVQPGIVHIPNSTSSVVQYYRILVDAEETVLHSDPAANPRIDAVVVFLDLSAAVDAEAEAVATIEVVEGAEAGVPTAPSDGDISAALGASTWHRLYNAAISNPFVSVTDADITDTRDYAYLDASKIAAGNQIDSYGFLDSNGDLALYQQIDANDKVFTYDEAANELWHYDLTNNRFVYNSNTGSRKFYVSSDSTVTNTMSFDHTGANGVIGVTTGDLHVFDAGHDVRLRVYSSDGGSDYAQLHHDGTDGGLSTGAGDLHITPAGGNAAFRSGTLVDFYDSTNTTYTSIVQENSLLTFKGTGASTDGFSFDTSSGDDPLYISRSGTTTESAKIYVDDSSLWIESIQDEAGAGDVIFVGNSDGAGAAKDAALGATVFRNMEIFVYDNSITDYLRYYHDGSNAIFTTNAGSIYFDPSSDLYLRDGSQLRINDAGDSDSLILYHSGASGRISTAGGESIIIEPSSNILNVYGAVRAFESTDTDNVELTRTSTEARLSASGTDLWFIADTVHVRSGSTFRAYNGANTQRIQIFHDGTGRINTYSGEDITIDPDGDDLNIGGDVLPTADNTYTCGNNVARWTQVWAVNGAIQTSDRTAKRDITNITKEEAENIIKSIDGVWYKWNDDEQGRRHAGHIAQDVVGVFPESVYDPAESVEDDVPTQEQIDSAETEREKNLLKKRKKRAEELSTGKLGMSYNEFTAIQNVVLKDILERLEVLEQA